jgi:D-serine deaminase-like pyridoxal phosphate-dependent protein
MASGDIGKSKYELDTPVLCCDLDVVEANIRHLAAFLRQAGVQWRPHTKGQKIPALAHAEIRAGAIGVTCAKLGEAEVMAAAGIRDILIANQVVGPIKAARLAALCRHADPIASVDSIENAEELSGACAAIGTRLRVVVEVDIGMNRAGVEPGDATVRLSEKVAALPGLRWVGLMGWDGHTGAIADPEERRRATEEAVGRLTATAAACRRAGLDVQIVSGGGTLTYRAAARVPGITEIQAGGGIFGDMLYQTRGVDHPCGLTVITTVTSRPTPTRIIVDAGRKTMTADAAQPRPKGLTGIKSIGLSAEHGKVELEQPNHDLRVGDKLEWIVGYSDTTVCLHDQMVATRGDRVEAIWPIAGRGKLS